MMEEYKSRPHYTREFKVETVELLLNGGQTAVEVSRNLSIRVVLRYR